MQEIINHTNREAAAIKKQRQDNEDAQRKAEEYRRLKQEVQEQKVAKAKEEEEKRLEHAKEQKRQQDSQEEEAREAAKRASIVKAEKGPRTHYKSQKLVAQLLQVRALVEPFEQNKTIGKRRLRLKKIVRGKVNTLSENAKKFREIATISRDSRYKARR